MKKILILIIVFYILALLESSFLIHFKALDIFPNLIIVGVILMNLFERPQENLAVFSAIVGGFFLDIFSERPFGLWIFILLTVSLFLKIILKKYIRIPTFKIF